MAETKRKRIFICIPALQKCWESQVKRAEELAARAEAAGFDTVTPFDIKRELDEKYAVAGNKPGEKDYMAEDFRELLDCDGILLEGDVKTSKSCRHLVAQAQVLAAEGSDRFIIYHTAEQWEYVRKKYVL